MALTTTFATSPILHFITPRRQLETEARRLEDEAAAEITANDRTGTLIPVSSTTAVASLLDIALSLTPADAPAPRVLALHRGSVTGGVSAKPEETFTPSRSPIFAAALDAAWSRGIAIKPEAVWTTDVATEIVDAAEKTSVRWVVLESRRSLFGHTPKRSIVNKVVEQLKDRPLNLAIVTPGSHPELASAPVTCLVNGPRDGYSALELAGALSRERPQAFEVLVLRREVAGDAAVAASAASAADSSLVDWIPVAHPQGKVRTIAAFTKGVLTAIPRNGILIVARDVLDVWQFSIDDLNDGRTIIVVQGAYRAALRAARTTAGDSLQLPTVAAHAV
jgi:hypothetical protein